MNKEVSDALHMLLHCALKDREYETQTEQFEIIFKYIEELHNKLEKANATIDPQSMRHYRNCLLKILKDSDVDE